MKKMKMFQYMLNIGINELMKREFEIISKHYINNKKAKDILLLHSLLVRDKAIRIAGNNPQLKINPEILEQGALLHDIGIFYTNAPEFGCYGTFPYICHGYLGRELLEKEGLGEISLIAERHTGTGLSLEEIKQQNLPLPHRNMIPITIEEQLVCFADKFYSKGNNLRNEISLKKIRIKLSKHGNNQLLQFNKWCEVFL